MLSSCRKQLKQKCFTKIEQKLDLNSSVLVLPLIWKNTSLRGRPFYDYVLLKKKIVIVIGDEFVIVYIHTRLVILVSFLIAYDYQTQTLN